MLPACRGVQSGHHVKLITEIQNAGAKVTISKLDVVDPEQAKELVALAEGIAPIAAIFHLAMVLDDRMLINQVLNPCMQCRAMLTTHALPSFVCRHAGRKVPKAMVGTCIHAASGD